jgi:hypothetical protein
MYELPHDIAHWLAWFIPVAMYVGMSGMQLNGTEKTVSEVRIARYLIL